MAEGEEVEEKVTLTVRLIRSFEYRNIKVSLAVFTVVLNPSTFDTHDFLEYWALGLGARVTCIDVVTMAPIHDCIHVATYTSCVRPYPSSLILAPHSSAWISLFNNAL